MVLERGALPTAAAVGALSGAPAAPPARDAAPHPPVTAPDALAELLTGNRR
ncbi:hypothetical protein ABZ876_10065 [Streptomyces sp. NPDC046931]|uniref:hypothetical protein n=1 Tax=Streptomyces sp. NPDC046931 TaxID=3154806 RepID=UPI0033D87AA4